MTTNKIHSVGRAPCQSVIDRAKRMMAMASRGVVHTLCISRNPSYTRVQWVAIRVVKLLSLSCVARVV